MAQRFNPDDLLPYPDLRFEVGLWADGFCRVAGIDEAGRGAWAGPVTAGAVILPSDPQFCARLPKVRDSKQMLPPERDYWAGEIRQAALAWGVGFSSSKEIDTIGIVPATRLAMQRALIALAEPADHLLVDALMLAAIPLPQVSLIKGDARSLSIAAASVLAKTSRDAYMLQLDAQYPGYGFARHKGYGTAAHDDALHRLGPCPIHRFCFSPIRDLS